MPGSSKMKKNREQAANRANGIGTSLHICQETTKTSTDNFHAFIICLITGDAQGRLPGKVIVEAVVANCTICMQSCRMSKTNTDAKIHCESKHPASTFAICFPGQFDPTQAVAAVATAAPTAAPAVVKPKPKPKTDDLSFLDSALAPKGKK